MRFSAAAGPAACVLVLLAAACGDHSTPTTVAHTPVRLTVAAGDSQSAFVNGAVATPPAVKVTDARGNGVAGAAVRFTVVAGGGAVQTASATTDAQGLASAGGWTLGASIGENSLEAAVDGLPSVRFIAYASSAFNIDLRIIGSPSPSIRAAIEAAAATWHNVLIGDLPDVQLTAAAEACFTSQPAVSETVDDLVLFVWAKAIDGVGKTLAESGPCYVRSNSSLPIMGAVVLDNADLPSLEASGMLQDVVTHEIGHVLGFGTIWKDLSLLQGAGGADPRFLGSGSLAAFAALGQTATGVPVENTGGAGTRDGHWRESVFGNELMTGYLNKGPNPLSALTVASMRDLGYTVDLKQAMAFNLPTTSALGALVPLLDLEPHEVLMTPKYRVDANGTVR